MKAEEIDCTTSGDGATRERSLREVFARDPRDLIVGGRTLVPTLDGTRRQYVNLDSAASTPIARPVKDVVDSFLEWYAAVHRGSGFKSQVSSLVYEQARERLARFVGAGLEDRCLIFVRNATEAINRCANRIPLSDGDVVLTSLMEHHSNILAWRRRCAHVESVSVDRFGMPVLEDLEKRLHANDGHVKLVAISGGSNVTGVIPDVRSIARVTHEAGAALLVDAAQLAPHRPIQMGPMGDAESIDFLAFSGHKMYAPLGCGVLIGPRSAFEGGIPELVGGGTVLFVSEEEEMWGGPPDSEEAGSPNVVGAVAMAAAARFLSDDLGWEAVVRHERELTSYALEKLNELPGLTIYGPRDPALPQDRLGVIAFNLEKVHHQLTAAILSHEYAIGTRTGGFCAHPYLMRLFGIGTDSVHTLRDEVSGGDRRNMPGAVRMSFGFYSTRDDVDAIMQALWDIQRGKWGGDYTQNPKSGEYKPTSEVTSPVGWFSI
ncbi:MAG TPA: aminotransferase class V-fold PLP-dependent enzyme [Chloroflexia bacterium]